ncbi:putative bifunctional diguanylate cyclase/phosphodiesterase [Granulosicoccus sp. 3-233]|uniref:putative bifunctional diguanylate cyclase/phosphodiesterase n=1 Tax=Granulosicoccus sp. 3-233 TaxID=3417969 RepID=UPI003D34FDF1
MGSTTAARKEAIRHNQNELLYKGVKFSVVGSLAAAVVAMYFFGPLVASQGAAWIWFTALWLVYLARALDCYLFMRATHARQHVQHWTRRFKTGALSSAIAWSLSMWMIFPTDDMAHQVLLVLTLGGVAAGALASLPYDRSLSNIFQLLIFTSVFIRLLVEGSSFSIELALFSTFVFGFLLACGKDVGKNYIDLLRLRQDSQETNLTLIRTTEQMARLGYWQWDLNSKAVDMSTNLTLMLGFRNRKVDIKDCFALMHPDDQLKVQHACAHVMKTGVDTEIEFRTADTRSGDMRHMRQVLKLLVDSDDKTFLLGTIQDVTDVKSAEQKIYSMAYYDDLSGLANRAHFHENLDAEFALARLRHQQFAIIYVDLDDFKGVNDSYGHECGDNYLKHFSNYLTSLTERGDMAARLGGDEFCLLLRDIDNRQEAHDMALQCLEYCNQIVQVGNHRIHPRLSVGIALFPDNAQTADDLVKCADMAMYTVKQAGKHSFAFYDEKMARDNRERVRLEADLRQALDSDEFELWYQPKFDILDNTLTGVEALIRWRHPDRGMIPPDLFISTAERVGMIKEIGEWVLANASAQLKQWNDRGMRLGMAVNISGDHFVAEGFCEFVFDTLRENGLKFQDIEIEITESLSRDPEVHTRICRRLRNAGVRVAIDDFGTGYSSLSVLGQLEVDTLKVDKSFIDGIVDDPAAQLMVRSIIDLSLGLGYDVVAEGVETAEQLDFLRNNDCPYIQGYLFSRPVEAEQIPHLTTMDWSLPRAA